MFDTTFKLTALGPRGIDRDGLIRIHSYSFRNAIRRRYCVEFHEYEGDIVVGKFYLAKDRNSPKKFNKLTNENSLRNTAAVISTVFKAFLMLHKKLPDASFGFIGAHTIANDESGVVEPKENTVRYRIYRRLCYSKISPETFDIWQSNEASTLILVNIESVKDVDVEDYIKDREEMFKRQYVNFELPNMMRLAGNE